MRGTVYPIALTTLRLVLGPAMVALAYRMGESSRPWLVGGLLLGIASDLADGTVARWLGVQSESLRRYDSRVDAVFWLCASWCVWVLSPDLVRRLWWAIAGLLVLEAAMRLIRWVRFGDRTGTHSYLAKAVGIVMVVAFVRLLGWGEAGIAFWIMAAWMSAADLDVILITALLPRWESRVPSAYHAWKRRQAAMPTA
jgi:CDP-diacylglycerol--glycerol-3-phosphate 3-phosphatidyltransferase